MIVLPASGVANTILNIEDDALGTGTGMGRAVWAGTGSTITGMAPDGPGEGLGDGTAGGKSGV
jgi:hypothetical protein